MEIPGKKSGAVVPPSNNEIKLEGLPAIGEYHGVSPTVKHNKWNQCTYQCGVCSKTSNSRSTITAHIVEDHGITFKEYRDKYPDLEVEYLSIASLAS